MTRDLETLANATPKDYLEHIPKSPEGVALAMIEKANRLFPIPVGQDGFSGQTNHSFLFVGPGSGFVIDTLLSQGQRAFAMEPSRRGIMAAPDEVRGYISWVKPWENNFPSKRGENPTPFKMFDVALINKYLKTYFTEEEWNLTVNEVKKISKYAAII